MRGERPLLSQYPAVISGSSPHARGTLPTIRVCPAENRFIPACAGNALRRFAVSRRPAVHPRMRGERGHCAEAACLDGGSSPHARGTQVSGRPDRMAMRFIPACAGNASTVAQTRMASAVHPRMRGERVVEATNGNLIGGSSPHARGTHLGCGAVLRHVRFIPACAGNALPISY